MASCPSKEHKTLAQEGEMALSLQASGSVFQGYFIIKVLYLLNSFESLSKNLLNYLVVGIQALRIMVQ